MKLEEIVFVLVETTHDGNIGAAARGMANMGLTTLRLVNPQKPVGGDAIARSAGAFDQLDPLEVFTNLDDAIADCNLVLATSARRRDTGIRVLSPWNAAEEVTTRNSTGGHKSAIIFGRESRGLTNLELDRCDATITFPVNDVFTSMNLGSAVALMSYELRLAALGEKRVSESYTTLLSHNKGVVPSSAERESFFNHLQQFLIALEFIKIRKPEKLLRKIRLLYMEHQLTSEQINIIRGIMSSIEEKVRKIDYKDK